MKLRALVLFCLCPIMAAAEEPSVCLKPTTSQYLRQLGNEWQKRLSLTEWSIDVREASTGELEAGSLGRAVWNRTSKKAAITVLPAIFYPLACDQAMRDQETTIVFQLLMITISELPSYGVPPEHINRGIQAMTNALMDLKYKRQ